MNFICDSCGRRESAATRENACGCGGLWRLDYRPPKFSDIDSSKWNIFRYRKYMGLESAEPVSLGEGLTPVIPFEEDTLFKLDYLMPTLSFKDRGAAALISHCRAIGVKRVVQDSSGNAGNSVAAYCARAGIACDIFVPEGTSPAKVNMIRAHGAACHIVPGNRDNCARVCREQAAAGGLYYANHVYNPIFYEGTKTYIYEVFEQLGRIPRHILTPVGNGTLFIGIMLALEHLAQSGLLDEMPTVIAVQSENCDPLLQAARKGETQPVSVQPKSTLAEGIAIGEPMRGEEILCLAKKYGVRFVHAPEDQILAARAKLAARGIYCEHTTAANYAGFLRYRELYGHPADCLIPICGAGLKSDH